MGFGRRRAWRDCSYSPQKDIIMLSLQDVILMLWDKEGWQNAPNSLFEDSIVYNNRYRAYLDNNIVGIYDTQKEWRRVYKAGPFVWAFVMPLLCWRLRKHLNRYE